jgi:drug/metabolite transporter (DMT)-like permease
MATRVWDRPYLLLTLAQLFWAGNIVLARFVAGHVPPVALATIRWSGAFLIVLPFAWPHLKREWPVIRRHWLLLTVLTLTGISAYNTMAYWGLQYTQAINGLLLQSIGPLLVAVWALVLFGERLSLGQLGGVLLSLAGVVVVICRGDPAVILDIDFNRGDVWFVAAIIIYALYSALLKQRPPMHQISLLAVLTGWGALWLIPVLAVEIAAGARLSFDPLSFATLAYVAVFPSLLGYLFFNRGVELIGPNRAAPFFHLIPVFGSALAILFLGEAPHLYHAAGYGLVLAGIAIATRRYPSP